MKKQTKVLVAAAMLTLGASFSAMAAQKGTWDNSTGEWMCYDKEGEAYEDEWCLYNGVEFYINEDGVLGNSEWVEGDDDVWYYAQSDGSKTKSAWKYIYGPDADEDDEEAWYWFDSKGKMKKSDVETINGYEYYFDAEGKMLTGWVDETSYENTVDEDGNFNNSSTVKTVVYCNEDGQRLESQWLYLAPFDMDPEDAYEDDFVDYYAGSDGNLYNNAQKTIDGFKYFFDVDGEVIYGWVGKSAAGNYYSLEDTDKDKSGSQTEAIGAETTTVYYTDAAKGYMKSNRWLELDDPTDTDTYWYHFDKLGRVFIATATGSNAYAVTFEDGDAAGTADAFSWKATASNANIESLKVGSVHYYFNTRGELLTGLQIIEEDGEKQFMYLDEAEDTAGARYTGKVTLTDENENDYEFYFAEKTEDDYDKYVAVNGNKNGYLYVNGLLTKSEESEFYRVVAVGDKNYIVDYRGKIQHKEDKEYELEDGTIKVSEFNDNDGLYEDSFAIEKATIK